ncbi:MAG: hypothetical protein AABY90_10895, partial [Nitrospirota bacterium]
KGRKAIQPWHGALRVLLLQSRCLAATIVAAARDGRTSDNCLRPYSVRIRIGGIPGTIVHT